MKTIIKNPYRYYNTSTNTWCICNYGAIVYMIDVLKIKHLQYERI